eukprot:Pgem_evm1s80
MQMNINFGLLLSSAFLYESTNTMWVATCPHIMKSRLDPIVNPGGASDHEHIIAGGSGFSNNMTYESTQASDCTSCNIQEDKSNYWTPSMYWAYKKNDKLVYEPLEVYRPFGQVVYYKFFGDLDVTKKVEPFPKNFRMLRGGKNRRTYDDDNVEQRYIRYRCDGNGKQFNFIPNGEHLKACRQLRAEILFPSCINKDMDYQSDQSHTAYPIGENGIGHGRCPDSHPTRIPTLFFETYFDVRNPPHPDAELVLSNGDTTGYSWHGDFINGWDAETLAEAVKKDKCGSEIGDVGSCGLEGVFNKLKKGIAEKNYTCDYVDNAVDPDGFEFAKGYLSVNTEPLEVLPGNRTADVTNRHPLGTLIFDALGKVREEDANTCHAVCSGNRDTEYVVVGTKFYNHGPRCEKTCIPG